MYSIEDIKDMIDPESLTNICILEGHVTLNFGDVIGNSFDDIIDMIDEEVCANYLPKADCDYRLVSCTEGFYYSTLTFYFRIDIDTERFIDEFFDED